MASRALPPAIAIRLRPPSVVRWRRGLQGARDRACQCVLREPPPRGRSAASLHSRLVSHWPRPPSTGCKWVSGMDQIVSHLGAPRHAWPAIEPRAGSPDRARLGPGLRFAERRGGVGREAVGRSRSPCRTGIPPPRGRSPSAVMLRPSASAVTISPRDNRNSHFGLCPSTGPTLRRDCDGATDGRAAGRRPSGRDRPSRLRRHRGTVPGRRLPTDAAPSSRVGRAAVRPTGGG